MLFREYLDQINPALVEKYNEILKLVFGIYDDENAIAMLLAMKEKIPGIGEQIEYTLRDESNHIKFGTMLINKIKESGNTLVLVDRIGAGKELTSRIHDAVFISGETKLTERKEEYDEVAVASKKTIVATYGVAAVGINIPRIFNLVLLEPGKSFVRVIQSIGRGIRKAEDKDFVQIWDITSTCKFAKRHLTKRKAYYKEANYPFSVEKINIL